MPTDFDKKLRPIIYALVYPQSRVVEHGQTHGSLFTVDEKATDQLVDELMDNIKQAVDDCVIGKDDVPRNTSEHSKRNFLRLEQRRSLWGPKAKA